MNGEQQIIAIVIISFFISVIVTAWLDNRTESTKDPIAERISAIQNATFGMSDESKERLIKEVLKGNTNDVNQIVLEKQ